MTVVALCSFFGTANYSFLAPRRAALGVLFLECFSVVGVLVVILWLRGRGRCRRASTLWYSLLFISDHWLIRFFCRRVLLTQCRLFSHCRSGSINRLFGHDFHFVFLAGGRRASRRQGDPLPFTWRLWPILLNLPLPRLLFCLLLLLFLKVLLSVQ